jgi:hypothetical protein
MLVNVQAEKEPSDSVVGMQTRVPIAWWFIKHKNIPTLWPSQALFWTYVQQSVSQYTREIPTCHVYYSSFQ